MDAYLQPEWNRSALITIDMQEDFTRPTGAAWIRGTTEVLPNLQKLIAGFRAASRPIVHAVRLYRPDGSNVDVCRRALVEAGKRIAAPDTAGAELVVELKPQNSLRLNAEALLRGELQSLGAHEWAMYKPRWGAFHETPLLAHLRGLRVNTVVVAGCNFPNCPRTTIYEASERDFRIVTVSDAISGIYDQGVTELKGIGVQLLPTTEVVHRVASYDLSDGTGALSPA